MPRKSKSQETSPYDGLRSMFELPFLMQFISLHQEKFSFPKISISEFEECLCDPNSAVIPDIIARLLRYFTGNSSILINSFESSLCQLLNDKQRDFNPLNSGKFADLSPEEKLQLLKWLVDLICESRDDDLNEFLNDSFDPESMRAVNVGQDAFNNTYWYFDDQRLYKENSKKAGKREWECVCLSLKDWRTLLKQFRKTTNEQEKELFDYLNNQLFPLVEIQLENQEKALLECSPGSHNTELSQDVLTAREARQLQTMVKLENMSAGSKDSEVKTEQPAVVKTEEKKNNNAKTELEALLDSDTNQEPSAEVKPVTPTTQSVPVKPKGPHSRQQSQESPFVQQRSQIFVFSTKLANKASEGVLQGRYDSILAYHMDQPGTKKFLQKHPMKPSQFNKLNTPGMPMYTSASDMITSNTTSSMPNGGVPPNQMVLPPNGLHSMNGGNGVQNVDWPGSPNSMLPDITHNKVPDENLTPEQLHRREEQLANIRKLQSMLFPDNSNPNAHNPQLAPMGNHPGNGRPSSKYGPQMGPYPQPMMGPNGSNMPGSFGPNMHGPGPHMMSPGGPSMMGPNGPIVPNGPPMAPGPNGQNFGTSSAMMMSHQQAMMSQPNVVMSQQNMMMSTSQHPNMTMNMSAQSMSMGPQPMYSPPMMDMRPPSGNIAEKEWARLQQEFYGGRGGAAGMRQQSTIHAANPFADNELPSQGPPPPYYSSVSHRHSSVSSGPTSPPMIGAPSPMHSPAALTSPHVNPPQGQFMYPPQRRPTPATMNYPPGAPMMPDLPPEMMGSPGMRMPGGHPKEVTVARAGHPEPFQPELTSSQGGGNKPPPSYAQSTKRKQRDNVDDLYKNLQPAPSPQHFTYPNQFEGQELTITKQLNAAYQESPVSQSPAVSQPIDTPISGPASVPTTGPPSVPPQGPASVPPPATPHTPSDSQVFNNETNAKSVAAAGRRLSHLSSPAPGTPGTPVTKPNLSNITSSSLANLAKGVEDMSHQMQQSMLQGGPFHSIQVQSQSMDDIPGKSTNSTTQGQQNVNNTYVNTTMSIGQLNIQQMNHLQNHPSQGHPGQGHPPQGHPPQGHPAQGHPAQGHPAQGHPAQGSTGVPSIPHMGGPTPPHLTAPPSAHSVGRPSSRGFMEMSQQRQQMMAHGPQMLPQRMDSPQLMGSPEFTSPHGPHMASPHGGMVNGPPFNSQHAHPMMPGQSPIERGPMMIPGGSPHGAPHMGHQMGPEFMGPSPSMSHPGQIPSQYPPGMPMAGMRPGMLPGSRYPQPSDPQFMSPAVPMPSQPMPAEPQPAPPPTTTTSRKRGRKTSSSTNVKVQTTAPNTIQYLPANPPSSQAGMGPPPPKRSFPDQFTEAFPAEPLRNLDKKVPSSKLSYFPPSEQNHLEYSRMTSMAPVYQPGHQNPNVMCGSPSFPSDIIPPSSLGHAGPPMGDPMMNHNMLPSHISPSMNPGHMAGMPPRHPGYGPGPMHEMSYGHRQPNEYSIGPRMSAPHPGPYPGHPGHPGHPGYGPQMGPPGPDFMGPPVGDPRYINMMSGM